MLLSPGDPNSALRYAEILYTIGGTVNLNTALKYASTIVKEHDYDLRANLILYSILRNMKGFLKKDFSSKLESLFKLVTKNIRSIYKVKGKARLCAKLPFGKKLKKL